MVGDIISGNQTPPPLEDLGASGNRLLQDHASVWVLGDSIPFWAGKIDKATGKANIKLDGRTIVWWVSGVCDGMVFVAESKAWYCYPLPLQ